MKNIAIMAVCAATLAGCGGSGGNTSPVLSNGTDTSFLLQGVNNCPGIATSNNPIYDRYPLRCGPQAQAIPR